MPVNLAEKWGLLPSHNYPYLAHNPKTPDDDWGPSHIEDPEWAAIWRKNRVAYEATLDENGNPPPIYEDFTPSSDFEGWDELEPEIDGLRTPDSTRSIPQPPLPSFVIRTPSPVRTGLPSPPPGDDITFPHPVQLDFPEFEDWDAVFKLTLPRRPITRSTNPTGKYCSLSYKPGKIACLQESDGIRESTYAELNSAAFEHDKHVRIAVGRQQAFKRWDREDEEREKQRRKERRAADKAKKGKPSRPVAGSCVQKRSAHKTSRGGRRTRGGLRGT